MISRSQEVKALGIKMGVPFFQIRDLVKKYRIAVFSSNFPLYLDISARVTETLRELCPRIEKYSVDESFLDLSGMQENFDIPEFCLNIKNTVYKHTGIPICVGVAPSKTLAKCANHAAKKSITPNGVAVIDDEGMRRYILSKTPVGDIWGIGSQLEIRIKNTLHISTALDFSACDEYRIRSNFNKTVQGTWAELNGHSVFELEDEPQPKKQMMWSRTFGHKVQNFEELKEILSGFTVSIMQKMREEHQYATIIGIFISTGFCDSVPYSASPAACFGMPTNDTVKALRYTEFLLRKAFKSGVKYARGGVFLQNLCLTPQYQTDMFQDHELSDVEEEKKRKLMAVLDKINAQTRNKVYFAAQGKHASTSVSSQGRLSPSYTTRWKDVPKVK